MKPGGEACIRIQDRCGQDENEDVLIKRKRKRGRGERSDVVRGLGYRDRSIGASGDIHLTSSAERRGQPGLHHIRFSSLFDTKQTNMQICKYANMQICKYANMQICKYANMQICKYAGNSTFNTKEMHVWSPLYNTPGFLSPVLIVRTRVVPQGGEDGRYTARPCLPSSSLAIYGLRWPSFDLLCRT